MVSFELHRTTEPRLWPATTATSQISPSQKNMFFRFGVSFRKQPLPPNQKLTSVGGTNIMVRKDKATKGKVRPKSNLQVFGTTGDA